MTYPKPIMRLAELVKLGYPREFLMDIYRSRNQKVAWKSGAGINSPIVFDTEELEKYRKSRCTGW